MEKARTYNAHSVFFEAPRNGRPLSPQAFVFVSNQPTTDDHFAELHRRLWSWGGVPLLYRKTPGQVQLFRCAHAPDFAAPDGTNVCKPFKILNIGSRIAAADIWWDADQLRNGTIWDDPHASKLMLSAHKAAHRNLVDAVRHLYEALTNKHVLTKSLRRRLLILCLLIAYLEEREVLQPAFFNRFLDGATSFRHLLRDGTSLVAMLGSLERRFNGTVFSLTPEEATTLRKTTQLERFARLVEGREETTGQLGLWRLYSFKDLPVELLSNIYQLFVKDSSTSVYTPPHLVRLVLDETLNSETLDRLLAGTEIILDPACGSGIFLVEAYKRVLLHWRSRNGWVRPTVRELRTLLERVHGIDLEEAAVELAAFSLCLTLCDALERDQIRHSTRLFPKIIGISLHHSCFFEAIDRGIVNKTVGVVVGNPPFQSALTTTGARRSYRRYSVQSGHLADKQLAYLFLHESMEHLAPGGILGMIQPAGFLYNQHATEFRRRFFGNWNVREVLDFVSVGGLFKKGRADPKIVVMVASANAPRANSSVLHAVFRRTPRAAAEQGFDVDYYDLHWLGRSKSLGDPDVWRANLLGGGRFLRFIQRLRRYRTLCDYAHERGWDVGEGYIRGNARGTTSPRHLVRKPLLPTEALSSAGLDASLITTVPDTPIERPRSPIRFTPPLLLVKEHQNLHHAMWEGHYLAYKNEIVGFPVPTQDIAQLRELHQWLGDNMSALRAYAAGISNRLFATRATSLGAADILGLPYPRDRSLSLSTNEAILADDVERYGRDFVRLGSESLVIRCPADEALRPFSDVFVAQINAVYPDNRLVTLEPYYWPGIVCQPFSFGTGQVDWTSADQLRGKLDALLREDRGAGLRVTRIARIYDGRFVFLLKPNRMRYWLRSIALRDADDVRSDLRAQGF